MPEDKQNQFKIP